MAWRDCIVCNENEHSEPYGTVDGYVHLRCAECGLIYVDHVECPENLYKSYSGGGFKSLRRRLLAPVRRFSHVRHFQESMRRAREIFEFASTQVNGAGDERVFLDVGCNKGFLLAAGIEQGWNVYGVEIVPELTAPFKNSYRQFADQVFAGRFEDCRDRFTSGMFDLVTANCL